MSELKDLIVYVAKEFHAFSSKVVGAAEAFAAGSQMPALGAIPSAVVVAGGGGQNEGKKGKKKNKKGFNADGSVKDKRKPTAYNLFMKDELARLKREGGDGGDQNQKAVFSAATSAWKDSYLNKTSANFDKARHDALLEKHDMPTTAEPAGGEDSGKRKAEGNGEHGASTSKKKSKKSKKNKGDKK